MWDQGLVEELMDDCSSTISRQVWTLGLGQRMTCTEPMLGEGVTSLSIYQPSSRGELDGDDEHYGA